MPKKIQPVKAFRVRYQPLAETADTIVFSDGGAGRARWAVLRQLWEANYDNATFQKISVRRAPKYDEEWPFPPDALVTLDTAVSVGYLENRTLNWELPHDDTIAA